MANNLSATGHIISYAPGAAAVDEDVFSIRVMNNNYSGIYRLIILANTTTATDAVFRVELEPYLTGATSYPIAYTPWVPMPISASTKPCCMDMGQITIPEDIGREPTVNGFNLLVHVHKADVINAIYRFYHIVLIPNDELAIEAFDDNANPTTWISSCTSLMHLIMDSAEDNKYTTKMDSWSSTAKQGVYRGVTRGAISAPPRHALRFWHNMMEYYLTGGVRENSFYQLTRVLLYDAERYIGLRGDR